MGLMVKFNVQCEYTWFVPKVSVLIFYLIIYWAYLKLQVISFEV